MYRKSSFAQTVNRVLFLALAASMVVMCAGVSFGQTTTPQFTEYAAKFLCGTVAAGTTAGPVAPGTYFTTINIHNPHENLFSTETSTSFLKKAVLSLQEGVAPVAPSALVQDSLANDFAEEVDCTIVRRLLGSAAPPAPAFIEGFVVLIVPPTSAATVPNVLDVFGVYTNSLGAIHIEPANAHTFTPGTTVAAAEAGPMKKR